MTGADVLGYIAAFCTTLAFVPQAMQVYLTKRTQDLSLAMFLLFTSGVALWLGYGLLIHSWPVAIANGFTLVLASYILIMKLTERRREPRIRWH